ncbi:MAG: hypothetical protein MZU97_18360 [Bacillus subtilis]|nr:hypothetical protein [Bacillus subtilis]
MSLNSTRRASSSSTTTSSDEKFSLWKGPSLILRNKDRYMTRCRIAAYFRKAARGIDHCFLLDHSKTDQLRLSSKHTNKVLERSNILSRIDALYHQLSPPGHPSKMDGRFVFTARWRSSRSILRMASTTRGFMI